MDWKMVLSDRATVGEAVEATRGGPRAPETAVAFDATKLDPFLKALYSDAGAAAALVTVQGHTKLLGNELFARDFLDPCSCNQAWAQAQERKQQGLTDPIDILGSLLSREDQGEFFESVGAMLFSNPRPCAEVQHIVRALTRRRESGGVLCLARLRFHIADGGGYSALVLSFQRLPSASRYLVSSSTQIAAAGGVGEEERDGWKGGSSSGDSNSMRHGGSSSKNSSNSSGLNLQGNEETSVEDDDTSASARSGSSSSSSPYSSGGGHNHRSSSHYHQHRQNQQHYEEHEQQQQHTELSSLLIPSERNATAAAMAGRVFSSYSLAEDGSESRRPVISPCMVYGGAQQVVGGDVGNSSGSSRQQQQQLWIGAMEDAWWVGSGPGGSEPGANASTCSDIQAPSGSIGNGEGQEQGVGDRAMKRAYSSLEGGEEEQQQLGRAATAEEGAQARAVEREEMLHFLQEYF